MKAQVRHQNLTECIHSLTYIDTFNNDDTVVQMARCSFDIHVQEIFGTFIVGATLIILHPRGTIDFNYLSSVLDKKQITYINSVPSLYHSLFSFLKECDTRDVMRYLRSVVSGGT